MTIDEQDIEQFKAEHRHRRVPRITAGSLPYTPIPQSQGDRMNASFSRGNDGLEESFARLGLKPRPESNG